MNNFFYDLFCKYKYSPYLCATLKEKDSKNDCFELFQTIKSLLDRINYGPFV